MSVVSKVGDGWPVGERDFDTIGDWDQARGGSSEFERCICAGLVLIANTTINGPYPAGAELIGLIEYDGEANHQDLALCDAALSIGTANVIVNDLWLDGPTGFLQSARIVNNGTNDSLFDNCYISAKPTNTTGSVSAANSGINRGFRRCVIDFNGRSVGYSTGWGTNVTFDGNIFKNYTTSALQSTTGGGGDRHFVNNFAVENTGSDLNITQAVTYENNATADSTGQYTGYAKDEFVDFDGGNYRIKSTSDLVALGIGAFFEDGGAVEPEPLESLPAEQLLQAEQGSLTLWQDLASSPAETKLEAEQAQLTGAYSNLTPAPAETKLEAEQAELTGAFYALVSLPAEIVLQAEQGSMDAPIALQSRPAEQRHEAEQGSLTLWQDLTASDAEVVLQAEQAQLTGAYYQLVSLPAEIVLYAEQGTWPDLSKPLDVSRIQLIRTTQQFQIKRTTKLFSLVKH